MDQTTRESERSEARRQLRSRATPAERDDFLRRWDELNGGPPSVELRRWAEKFLSEPDGGLTGVAEKVGPGVLLRQ